MSSDEQPGEVSDARVKRRALLEQMTPQQLDELRSWAWDRLMRARKVTVDGKTTTLRSLRDQVAQQREQMEHGLFDEDVRTIPRWQAQELVPSARLRPGAYKQVLKEEEEDALELQCMGSGAILEPRKFLGNLLPVQRNAAYGIFARADRVQQVLRPAWAERDPEAVLADPAFFDDVLRRCHQVEMTLVLLASRPLALAEVRPAVEAGLRRGMQRLGGAEELAQDDASDLKHFVRLFDDRRLEQAGWVDQGRVQAGTHLVFTTTPAGGITAEAITPGPLRDRKTSFIGRADNPLLTGALFDAFLGPAPVDVVGRRQVASGFLWAANGLAFKPGQHPDTHLGRVMKDGSVRFLPRAGTVQEHLPATTAIFRLLDGGMEPVRMLLDHIAGGGSSSSSSSGAGAEGGAAAQP